MTPALFALAISILSINLLLGLPKAVNLAQAEVKSANIFNQIKESKASEPEVYIPPALIDKGLPAPFLSATSVTVLDLDSKKTLYVKDPEKRVPIASTTKIITALLALESFNPNDTLIVPDMSSVSGSKMGLLSGEKITVRSLLYGLLLNSGNDAAFTLASSYPGGLPAFISAMNQMAVRLNLKNTNFDNPAGFDSPYHFSSASDLAKIAGLAAENTQLAKIISTKETSVYSIDNIYTHPLKNLNKMLGMPGVLGMKTGTTPQAKENLVGLFEKHNRKILTVVLGSNDRFGETQSLLDWLEANFNWQGF